MLISCCGRSEVGEYFSVLLRSGVVYVRFLWVRQFQVQNFLSQRVSRCNFLPAPRPHPIPVTIRCPWSSQFPDSLPFYVGALKAAQAQVWWSREVTGSHILFSSVSSSSSSHLSHCFLASSSTLFFSTGIFFSSNCAFMSPSAFLLLCTLVLTPTLNLSCSLTPFPFVHLSLSDCPSRTIYQEWHPLTFQPSSLSAPFLTQKSQKVEKLTEERRREEQKERKKALISEALNPVSEAWTGKMEMGANTLVLYECVCTSDMVIAKSSHVSLPLCHTLSLMDLTALSFNPALIDTPE